MRKNDVVLDIGANDGTLLKYYKQGGYKTIVVNQRIILKRNYQKRQCNK